MQRECEAPAVLVWVVQDPLPQISSQNAPCAPRHSPCTHPALAPAALPSQRPRPGARQHAAALPAQGQGGAAGGQGGGLALPRYVCVLPAALGVIFCGGRNRVLWGPSAKLFVELLVLMRVLTYPPHYENLADSPL